MACNKIEPSLLQELLDETMDPLEKIFVESHLKTCKDCRRELSELKLLFWELDNKSSYIVEFPKELDEMGTELVKQFLGKERNIAKQIMDVQLNSLKISSNFLKHVPGAKQTSGTIKKVSKGLKKEFKKLIKVI